MKATGPCRALSWLGICTWAQVGLQRGSVCWRDAAIPKAALGSDVTFCHHAVADDFAWGIPGGLYICPQTHTALWPLWRPSLHD